MKYLTQFHANEAAKLASSFQHVLHDGRRLTIASEHTDARGAVLRFWLHLQTPIEGQTDRWHATGLYLEKGGFWHGPHGSKSIRFFSTPEAAAKTALKWAYDLNRHPVPTY